MYEHVRSSVLLITLLIGMIAQAQEEVTLTFATWGNSTEIDLFNRLVEGFESEHPNVTIELQERPDQNFRDQLVAELAASQAPDVIRAGFSGDLAFYADAGATVDLTPYLDDSYGDDFFDAAWAIVQYDGKPYGLPFVTDTHALFYNKDYIEQAGITVPTSLEECWSWDEFTEQSRKAMENSDADYGHAALWNAKRWVFFLYGNGGQLLTDDLTAPAITNDAGVETIAWTKSWYDEGLTPLSTSMKASEQADELFVNGSVAFLISGSWHLPNFRENMQSYRWGVTYLPCTPNGQDADLGGNGFAVTKDSAHPDVAAEFIKYMTDTENMRMFASEAFFSPVRDSALEGLDYPDFTDEMKIFSEIAETVSPKKAATQALPIFPEMTAVLTDELDLAFVGEQSPEQTAQNIADKIAPLLGQ